MQKNQLLIPILFCALVGAASAYSFVEAKESLGVTINNQANSTKTRTVSLGISGGEEPVKMMISNSPTFSGSQWEQYAGSRSWYLDAGSGMKTVYAKFQNKSGKISETVQDMIELAAPGPIDGTVSINKGALETNSRTVTLELAVSAGVDMVAIAHHTTDEVEFIPVQKTVPWILESGTGEKTVYVHMRDVAGNIKTISDSIRYEQPARYLPEGSLVRSTKSLTYYVGYDGKLHPFLHPVSFHSWYQTFTTIQVVGESKLREYQIGDPVCIAPGTWLVAFGTAPRIYAVEPGCVLRPLRSETEATLLYGKDWRLRLTRLDMFESNLYSVRGLSAAQPVYDIVDRDGDGVDSEKEKQAGSSDLHEDTDADNVSDYEEILYWFSDPAKKDTDGDGQEDGKEIMQGTSPTGAAAIQTLPAGTYRYPRGALSAPRLFSHGNFYGLSEEDGIAATDIPHTQRYGRLMPL